MKTEQTLRKEADAIRAQLYKIESARRAKENGKHVGRCYKYRNNYGGDCPGWWLFAKITGGGQYLKALKFQHTARNSFEIEHDDSMMSLDGWTEITPKAFDAEWRKFLRRLKALNGSNNTVRQPGQEP